MPSAAPVGESLVTLLAFWSATHMLPPVHDSLDKGTTA
jgi:hypothetical protein